MTTRWETRLRGNNPKFIDILTVGAADSSGAIARVPMRDGYFNSNLKTAALIAAAPELLDAIERCYKMLMSTPNVKDALFAAENILREAWPRRNVLAMKPEEAGLILRLHNQWRRGDESVTEMLDPKIIGEAIDCAISAIVERGYLLDALEILLAAVHGSACKGSGPAQDAAAEAIHKAKGVA